MPNDQALANFCAFFKKLDNICTEKLYKVYTEEVIFNDPLHHIEGRLALERYLATLYENVERCQFTYHTQQQVANQAFVTWTMEFVHPRLAQGKPIYVAGCSSLTFAEDGRVSKHCDYFDVGAMLYEHLPIMGRVIRWLKRRIN